MSKKTRKKKTRKKQTRPNQTRLDSSNNMNKGKTKEFMSGVEDLIENTKIELRNLGYDECMIKLYLVGKHPIFDIERGFNMPPFNEVKKMYGYE